MRFGAVSETWGLTLFQRSIVYIGSRKQYFSDPDIQCSSGREPIFNRDRKRGSSRGSLDDQPPRERQKPERHRRERRNGRLHQLECRQQIETAKVGIAYNKDS